MYSYPSDWYREESREMAKLLRNGRAAYVYQDPKTGFEFAHEHNVQLIGQQLDIPVVNGLSANYQPGYYDKMRPRAVLAKGTKFDFNGFVYLVPISEEPGLQKDLRDGGLSLVERGRYFAAYQPYGRNRHFGVDFQIVGDVPTQLKPQQEVSVFVLATNRCDYPWQPFGKNATEGAYWALDPETERMVGAETTSLDRVMFPGDREVIRIKVKAPPKPGTYLIRMMMIQQGLRWFNPEDPTRAQFEVRVAP